MNSLPNDFLAKMKNYLGSEYDEFLSCYDQPFERGIRLNTLKCDEKTLRMSFGSELRRSPFSELSFYTESEKVGKMPLHSAGGFYSQEPSASSAVAVLNPEKGDKILDMCAAPGGKSTQIAAALNGTGLLWSNEVVRSRANILLSNIERMGIRNAVVSSVYPNVIAERLTGYFDKILVDAPCSGEGMFRKNPDAIDEWSIEHVETCASRQLAILESAAQCLRDGGVLVYSTCTFSCEENEGVTKEFLKRNHNFEIVPIHVSFGRPAFDGVPALRILPMDGGEGHYVAKFQKTGNGFGAASEFRVSKVTDEVKLAEKLYSEIFSDRLFGRIYAYGDKAVVLPEIIPDISGLGVLRAGVAFGELRRNRIEPHHALFMAQYKENCLSVVDFSHDSPELLKFLHGEEINCSGKGYTAVCVDGVTVGFGKASGGTLKNRYPKGLRYL